MTDTRPPKRFIVCGGRDYFNVAGIFSALDRLHAEKGIACVIHGAAKGADTIAQRWAIRRRVPFEDYPAKWGVLDVPGAVIKRRADGTEYNAVAGIQRNSWMLQIALPDGTVAFPGGDGTADMVKQSWAAGLKVWFPMGERK